MLRHSLITSAVVLVGFVVMGCASSKQEGVKTNYMSQWTMVNANTTDTTDAAKAVLEAEGLKDVKASSSKMDGKATAKKADGTKINVAVAKKSDTSSEVSVTVGTMGDPSLGAEIAKKIKDKAEGR